MTSTSESPDDQPDDQPGDHRSDSGPGISDDKLPEDLRPSEDNPLAEPLDEDVDPDDLDVLGGKGADEPTDHSATSSEDD